MATDSKLVTHKVHNHSEAIEAIESGKYRFVELDYDMIIPKGIGMEPMASEVWG